MKPVPLGPEHKCEIHAGGSWIGFNGAEAKAVGWSVVCPVCPSITAWFPQFSGAIDWALEHYVDFHPIPVSDESDADDGWCHDDCA